MRITFLRTSAQRLEPVHGLLMASVYGATLDCSPTTWSQASSCGGDGSVLDVTISVIVSYTTSLMLLPIPTSFATIQMKLFGIFTYLC